MKSIFLDNYRGFQRASIALEDVNFCVGENSAGKTSFLAAINLLASNRFWFEQNFEGNEVPFRHFDDFVSVSARDKSYFRLGVLDTEERSYRSTKKEEMPNLGRAFLFTYTEHDGVPRLSSFTTNYHNNSVTVYISDSVLRYRLGKFDPSALLDQTRHGSLFEQWAGLQGDRSLKGTKLIKDEGIIEGYAPPLYALIAVVRDAFSTKNSEGKRIYNSPPFPRPLFGADPAWIAPIRAKPRRTYDAPTLVFSPEGAHMPYVLKRMLTASKDSAKFVAFLKRFGRESGLFKEVNVHKFGAASNSPFEIEVLLDRNPLNINNVGYGVAQGLPVVVEAFVREPGTVFVIQQPEVHLHPRAQASIGEMVFNLAARDDKKFVIETHSDFTIDRFRIAKRDAKKEGVASQVLFFQRSGGMNAVSPIRIDDDGELVGEQPAGYRDFFLKESLRLIGF